MNIKYLKKKYKVLISIMSSLALIPVVIGLYYICRYDWCNVTTEWGAVATWYAGLLSICLLYMTLQQQMEDSKGTAEQQALQILADNVTFLVRLFDFNMRRISGKFSYYDEDKKSHLNEEHIGFSWFAPALWELERLHEVLLLESEPENMKDAYSMYKCKCRDCLPRSNDEFMSEDEEKEFEQQYREIHNTILKPYFQSIIKSKYNIPSVWWKDKCDKRKLTIHKNVYELFMAAHPEFYSVIDVLNAILMNIINTTNKYSDGKCSEDYRQIANVVYAVIPADARAFFVHYTKFNDEFRKTTKKLGLSFL